MSRCPNVRARSNTFVMFALSLVTCCRAEKWHHGGRYQEAAGCRLLYRRVGGLRDQEGSRGDQGHQRGQSGQVAAGGLQNGHDGI